MVLMAFSLRAVLLFVAALCVSCALLVNASYPLVVAVHTLLVFGYAALLVILAMRGRAAPFLLGVAITGGALWGMTVKWNDHFFSFRIAMALLERLPTTQSAEKSASIAMLVHLMLMASLAALFGCFAQRATAGHGELEELANE